ncbi:hypothetical protein V6N11_073699 [Hibiscus sabdariffa]|uniref:Uncharacterized protein n=1 Tax=Hibiscus sabdariffa TaxID=183260 RepID=A0ABR1ZDZ7_9ROSI
MLCYISGLYKQTRVWIFNSFSYNPVQLQVVVATDDATRRSVADPAVQTSCSDQSLKTMMEICIPGALLPVTLLPNLHSSVSPSISDNFQGKGSTNLISKTKNSLLPGKILMYR